MYKLTRRANPNRYPLPRKFRWTVCWNGAGKKKGKFKTKGGVDFWWCFRCLTYSKPTLGTRIFGKFDSMRGPECARFEEYLCAEYFVHIRDLALIVNFLTCTLQIKKYVTRPLIHIPMYHIFLMKTTRNCWSHSFCYNNTRQRWVFMPS